MTNPTRVLAYCTEEETAELAALVLEEYHSGQVRLLSGPRQGLVMLQVRESVAAARFNAGEVLVTEVRLELDGQFGFGMIMGDRPRQALALALLDAAWRKGGPLAQRLESRIAELDRQLAARRSDFERRIAASKVEFETF